MSITLIVRPREATAGGEIRDIAGEGTIDTPAEAEAALRQLAGGHADSVVIIGGETYDRTRLEAIRNGGAAAARPAQEGGGIRIATIRPLQAMSGDPGASRIPAGSRVYVYLDGRPVGDGFALNAETPTDIRIPAAAVPENRAYAVEYRFSRPGMPQLRLNETLNVRPRIATLTNASVLPPSSGTSFVRESIRVRFQTNAAADHRVRVAVGGHTEDATVPAGTITAPATTREVGGPLTGQPGAWPDIGGSGRRRIVPVTVTPLGPGNEPGTAVPAGNVTIVPLRARRRSRPQAAGRQAPAGLATAAQTPPPSTGGNTTTSATNPTTTTSATNPTTTTSAAPGDMPTTTIPR